MISWDDFNADEKPTTKAQTTPAGTAQAAARVTVAPAPAMAPASTPATHNYSRMSDEEIMSSLPVS